jgi:peptide deformylase
MERLRLKIVQAGEPVLREPARELTVEEILSAEVRNLVELMRETMHDAPGVGLAAPQIGMSLRLAIIEDRPEYHRPLDPAVLAQRERAPVPFHVLFNPKITTRSEDTVAFYEGCLSVAGFSALVPRARRVTVEYLDETAAPRRLEASGWYARILQHEIDHLDGHLYLERMDPATFSTVENLTRYSNPAKTPK